MRPADHPEFFLRPPPAGRSRESTLRLDRHGKFWHDGELVTHPGMARSFAGWIDEHPVDGRYVLNNGYDWTYVEVEDAPCHVRTVYAPASDAPASDAEPPWLELADAQVEPLDAGSLWIGEGGALYCRVRGGRLVARFSQGAQLALEPYLVETAEGRVALRIGGEDFVVEARPPEAVSGRG